MKTDIIKEFKKNRNLTVGNVNVRIILITLKYRM